MSLDVPRWMAFVLECLLTVPAVLLAQALGLSSMSWLMGGLLAGAVGSRIAGRVRVSWRRPPNRGVRQVGQALVGVSLGFSLLGQDLSTLASTWPIIALSLLGALGGGWLLGRAFARVGDVDALSAGLAMLPGGVGVMAAVAAERGALTSLVAVLQAMRVAAVVATVPFVGGALAGAGSGAAAVAANSLTTTFDVAAEVATLVGAYLFARLAKRLRVPASALLGPLVAGLLLSAGFADLAPNFAPPHVQELIGQALLGISIGEMLQVRDVRQRPFLAGMAAVLLTIVLGLAMSAVIVAVTDIPWLTAVLLTAPGGAPEMIVVAAAFRQDVALVVLAQIIRQVAVNGLLPFWLWSFRPPGSGHARALKPT